MYRSQYIHTHQYPHQETGSFRIKISGWITSASEYMYCTHDSIDISIYFISTSEDVDVRCPVDEVTEEECEGEEFPGQHIDIFRYTDICRYFIYAWTRCRWSVGTPGCRCTARSPAAACRRWRPSPWSPRPRPRSPPSPGQLCPASLGTRSGVCCRDTNGISISRALEL